MSYFKDWLIKEDIFGFEDEIIIPKKTVNDEKPLHVIDVENVISHLAKLNLGEKLGFSNFVNEAQWGNETGALRVRINQKLKVVIERFGRDLSGNPRWYCKKIYQLNRTGGGGTEPQIVEEILETLQKINQKELDSPKTDYKLEDLVSKVGESVKRVASDMFIFEGIRKINDFNYIIRFSLRGQGVQAPNQKRVEENQTQVVYDQEAGLLRMTNYNVVSCLGEHKWELSPPDHLWYFFPTQEEKEIAETIANVMFWY